MKPYPITIKPFGETAILLEWPKEVNEDMLHHIMRFNGFLKTQFGEGWSLVPAYNSLALIHNEGHFDFQSLKAKVQAWYNDDIQEVHMNHVLWKLPVCYDLDFGLDLEETAYKLSMTIDELVEMHTSRAYTVFGIGFLPGFMYLGGLPKTLETKRLETPRLHVQKGSVGLAGKQTGIYPQDSPGGWNIIGRCPVPMFNLNRKEPCFVQVGDKIQFTPIDRATFDLKVIEAEVGIYQPEKSILNA